MFKDSPKLKKIFLAGFLLSFHVALTAYINSSFLSSFVGESWVSVIYIFGAAFSISALLFIPRILSMVGNHKFLLWSVGLGAAALISLSMFSSPWIILPVFVIYLTLNSITFFLLDELVEIFSKNSGIGKTRGFYLAIVSLAWVIAQSIFGKILNSSSFNTLYFAAFCVMAALWMIVFFYLKEIPDPKYDKEKILPTLKKFFKNKNLFRAYKINFLLQFFYTWMVIYTPIYLHAHLGFSWGEIGTIFTIMLTPFVFMPLPLGKYSDKIGERTILILGFLLISFATLFLFFIQQHELWIWALALFATRVGAATVETMSDVYFFKHINPENAEFIGIYRNTVPVAYAIGPLVAFSVLLFVPSFNYLYIILGTFMLFGIYLASTIEKNDI